MTKLEEMAANVKPFRAQLSFALAAQNRFVSLPAPAAAHVRAQVAAPPTPLAATGTIRNHTLRSLQVFSLKFKAFQKQPTTNERVHKP